MKILGISNAETSSACLVINGKVVSAVSEERFTRIKMDDSFPYQSINYVLTSNNLKLIDIDFISYGWKKGFEEEKHFLLYYDRLLYEMKNNPNGIDILKDRINVEISRDKIKRDEFDSWSIKNSVSHKIFYINHHECHAISSLACSPFNKGLVVTSDARGDFESLQVGYFDNKTYKVLYRCPTFDSLGFFYGRITSLLGYTPTRHEGKITGLAAYGNPFKHLDLMKKMINYKNGKIIGYSGKWYKPFFSDFSDSLIKLINKSDPKDISAAAQYHLEDIIVKIIKFYLNIQPSKYICLAGGVFGNVKVNQRIREIKGIENVFVQPHMGDGGLALGSAIGVPYLKYGKKTILENMNLGPEFSNENILIELKKNNNIHFEFIKNISKNVINEIKKNKVIGFFQGRMEFGPRALCSRSIIYHCNDPKINTSLNKRLQRTEFMPFAPITAEELASDCYKGWKPNHVASRYMTMTYDCTKKMVKNCPAVVHVDETARPQIINSRDNPLIHKILMEWYKSTGGMSLVNTSFNKHEEPIVCSPDHAINTLIENRIDVLIIGNYIVKNL